MKSFVAKFGNVTVKSAVKMQTPFSGNSPITNRKSHMVFSAFTEAACLLGEINAKRSMQNSEPMRIVCDIAHTRMFIGRNRILAKTREKIRDVNFTAKPLYV